MYPEIFQRLDEKFPSQCHKFERFRAAYEPIRKLPGDFAEFGVGNGGGTRELARLDVTRRVWAFDTFHGMPAEDYHEGEDSANPPGKWTPDAPPIELFKGLMNVAIVPGRFEKTLKLMRSDALKFLIVHLDCDYYESYRQVLEFLEDHMTPLGMAFVDDYAEGHNCLGCRRAVDEWLGKMGDRVTFDGDRIFF